VRRFVAGRKKRDRRRRRVVWKHNAQHSLILLGGIFHATIPAFHAP
jgi:hypothetical protein